MTFFQKPVAPTPIKRDKCVVKIKRLADGGISKSIEGNCTKEQLAALASEHNSEI